MNLNTHISFWYYLFNFPLAIINIFYLLIAIVIHNDGISLSIWSIFVYSYKCLKQTFVINIFKNNVGRLLFNSLFQVVSHYFISYIEIPQRLFIQSMSKIQWLIMNSKNKEEKRKWRQIWLRISLQIKAISFRQNKYLLNLKNLIE